LSQMGLRLECGDKNPCDTKAGRPKATGLVFIDVCIFLSQIRVVFDISEPAVCLELNVEAQLRPTPFLMLDNPPLD